MGNRLSLLDAGYTLQAEITRLERGLPIAEAKAKSTIERMKKCQSYLVKIKALREQIQAINTALLAE